MSRSAVPNFCQIGHETKHTPKNPFTTSSMAFTEPTLGKLKLVLLLVKNSYTEFHEYPTKGLFAEIRLQTDGHTGSLQGRFYSVKNASHASSLPVYDKAEVV
jgi:hypothetical protein